VIWEAKVQDPLDSSIVDHIFELDAVSQLEQKCRCTITHKPHVLTLMKGNILEEAWKNIPQKLAVLLSCWLVWKNVWPN
jgi:hypothetical protein